MPIAIHWGRFVVGSATRLAGVFALLIVALAGAQGKQPNIVVIWSDDQAARTLGCEGNTVIRTPNIDRLAAEGVRFSRHYIPAPLCGPSRAAFITGRYPYEAGMMNNRDDTFDHSLTTLPQMLRGVGYRCALVGKWHLGEPFDPQCGFDDYWAALDLDESGGPAIKKHFDMVLWKNGRRVETRGYGTSVLTDYALRYIRSAATAGDRPFFLWLAYRSPHWPYLAPPGVEPYDAAKVSLPASITDDLSGKPKYQRDDPPHISFKSLGAEKMRESIAVYYAMVTAVDQNVGRVMACLDELGIADDTIVIYASDNGWLLGEHQMHGKSAAFYEELVRMPLVVRWPCGWPRGRIVDALVSSMDLFPTLARIGGAALPSDLDGFDLSPLARGQVASVREYSYLSFDRKEGRPEPRPMLGVVTSGFKYNRYLEDGSEELYDLTRDPFEMENAVEQPRLAEQLAHLRAKIDEYRTSIRPPFWDERTLRRGKKPR